MKAEIQNQLWAILPKEARIEVKVAYGIDTRNKHFDNSYNTALIDIFGLHNLTSDTRPEEMLMVERKKVQDLYSTMDKAFPREAAYSVQEALKSLFGDKCLPDKELKEDNFEKSELRFRIGDKVKHLNGEVYTITSIRKPLKKLYEITVEKGFIATAQEMHLEPYTEENKDTLKVHKNTPTTWHLSDEDLDNLITDLITIRDKRRKMNEDIENLLKKLKQ